MVVADPGGDPGHLARHVSPHVAVIRHAVVEVRGAGVQARPPLPSQPMLRGEDNYNWLILRRKDDNVVHLHEEDCDGGGDDEEDHHGHGDQDDEHGRGGLGRGHGQHVQRAARAREGDQLLGLAPGAGAGHLGGSSQ